MIEIKDVTIVKGGQKIFDKFSFKISPGENWVIQGANGSGKSTLLQVIAGSLHPASGEVNYSFLQGGDWQTRFEQRRENIHMIASYGLHALRNGADGLFYQQRYYSIDNTPRMQVRDLLGKDSEKIGDLPIPENLNIQGLLDLELTRLSNGQIKKVIILRQLVRNIPKLLLLDYPFDGLDAQSRHDLTRFLDAIVRRLGIQMILVDHGHALPEVINRRLVLNQFQIESFEEVTPSPTAIASPETFNSPASEGEAVVEMKDLSITYNGKTILKNVNWRINRGERWALTGRNGSGKTTLFSLIYADHPMAYSQAVYLFGKRRGTGESIWDIKKRINYMGPEQIHFLNPKETMACAREYILAQAPTMHGRLDNLVDFFHAESYIGMPLRRLSSGQLQMVLLMKTFLDERALLLLDEPFQFLDPHNRSRISDYLNSYLDRDVTLVLITHDENDVAHWTQKRKHL